MGKYRLYANGAPPSPQPGDDFDSLEKDTPLDNFIALLPGQVLILTSKPDLNSTSHVNSDDEMIQWFKRIDETPDISITFTGAQTPHALKSFQINLATPWPMKFTSTVEDLQQAFPDNNSQLSQGGLATDGRWLVCALSKTMAPIKSTVTTLFDCACIPSMTKFVPKSLLGLSVTLQQNSGTRNAIWFAPSSSSPQTVIRLQFKVDAILELQKLIGGVLKGLTVEAADVICKQNWALAETTTGMKAVGAGNVMFTTRCSIVTEDAETPKVLFNTGIEISETAMTLTFLIQTPTKSVGPTDVSTVSTDLKTPGFLAIVKWLAGLVSPDLESFINEVLTKDGIASRIHLRRLIVRLDTTKDSSPVLDYASLDVEISTTAFGQAPNATKPIVFLLSYTWSKRNGGAGTIRGSFWNDFDPPTPWSLAPLLEDWEVLTPETHPEPAKAIDLRYIIPGQTIDSIPDTIPSQITRAYLSLSQTNFALGGTITAADKSDEETTKPTVPQPFLGEVRLDASYSWGKQSDFSLELGIVAGLRASLSSPPELDTAATLIGSLKYKSTKSKDNATIKDTSTKDSTGAPADAGAIVPSGQSTSDTVAKDPGGDSRNWELSATLEHLYAASLVEFFDPDVGKHVIPLIESLIIDHLDVTYKYSKTGDTATASEFTIDGSIRVASIVLNLDFWHKGSGNWGFSASLNPQNEEATLSDVLHSMLSDTEDLDLPDFVANMKLVAKTGSDVLGLRVGENTPPAKKTDDTNGAVAGAGEALDAGGSDGNDAAAIKFFYLIASINIGGFSFTFAQIHSSDWEPTASSKRLFRAKVDLTVLPTIHVDLIGDLKLPLDDMYYIWTQDKVLPQPKDSKTEPRQAGMTRVDLDQLNSIKPFEGGNEILVKDDFKTQVPADLMLAAGSYFGIIGVDSSGAKSCILGYDFKGSSKKAGESDDTMASSGNAPPDTGAVDDKPKSPAEQEVSGPVNPSAHTPLKKKAGPLSVSNVGLKYKGKTLSIILDASFDLGPLAFALLGFSIDLEIKTLDSLKDVKVSFALEGLSAAFDKPPLTIAGIIRRGNTGGIKYYAGGLIISYIPYQFMAAGFFGEVRKSGEENYTSVFVFAKLDGPLVSLGFAEISGVTGGFGYNSLARMPAIEDVVKYPLVAPIGLKDANSALEALQTLTDPGQGGWFSPANKTYWAAAGLKVDAFQMVSIDAVVLAQFGNGSVKLAIFAVAVADIPSAKSPVKLAHVELGMSLTVDPDYGLLKVEAQLAPGSYILAPDCHLTGGMALVYWFDGPHADKNRVGDFVFTLGGYHEAMVLPPGWPNPPRLGISWGLGSHLSISGQAYFAVTPKICMAGARLHASFSAGPIAAWFDAFADFLINYKPFHFIGHVSIAVGVSFNIDFLFIHTHISVEIGADLTLWGPPLAGTVHVDLWVASFSIDFGAAQNSPESVDLYAFYLLVLPASLRQASGLTPDQEKAEVSRPPNEGHNFVATSGLVNTDEDPKKQKNAPWSVRGGLFCFVAECKMPVSNVQLVTGKDDHGNETTVPVEFKKPDGSSAEPPSIYSKPMLLRDPMTSTFTIEYTQDGVDIDETNWQMEMVWNAMPTGLWAQYQSNTDPSLPSTGTGQLLDQDSASIQLMMGLRVTAPKPILSHDPYPIFDVVDANLVELTAERHFEKPKDSNAKLFAPQPSFEDHLPPNPTEEDIEQAIKDQYDSVLGKWKAPMWEATDVKTFVNLWQSSLGWDVAAGRKGGSDGGLADIAAIPEKTAEQFGDLYVAPPLLAAAVAA
ncbi:hypothetical protein K4K52_002067 [Colletotrichum sp. SAR 10_76]|nr:hypothetical protein K4K52_002067 [Colletotrichum sp. SAR 10_76]